jgi:hypothetical protein
LAGLSGGRRFFGPRLTAMATNPAAMPGPGAVAGAILLRNTLARPDIDEHTKAAITKQLAGLMPGQVVNPGGTVDQRTVSAGDLAALIPSAAVSAAGLDPAKTTTPPPPVLWQSGGNDLLVNLAGVTAALSTGLVEFTIPVTCDQTGDTQVTVTFATASANSPTGGVTTTENRPRGAAVVVENWHEALIALAWNTLVIATSALSGAAGADRSGRSLIANSLSADKDGLTVRPMARHTFVRTDASP